MCYIVPSFRLSKGDKKMKKQWMKGLFLMALLGILAFPLAAWAEETTLSEEATTAEIEEVTTTVASVEITTQELTTEEETEEETTTEEATEEESEEETEAPTTKKEVVTKKEMESRKEPKREEVTTEEDSQEETTTEEETTTKKSSKLTTTTSKDSSQTSSKKGIILVIVLLILALAGVIGAKIWLSKKKKKAKVNQKYHSAGKKSKKPSVEEKEHLSKKKENQDDLFAKATFLIDQPLGYDFISGLSECLEKEKEDDLLSMIDGIDESEIRTLFLTPKFVPGQPGYSKEDLEREIEEISELAAKDYPYIRFISGERVIYNKNMYKTVRAGGALTLAGSRYLLVDYPKDMNLVDIEKNVEHLVALGIRPIIAHIETFEDIDELEECEDLIEAGAYLMTSLSSYTGLSAGKYKKHMENVFEHELISFVESDSKFSLGTSKKIYDPLDWIRKITNDDYMERLLYDNPEAILENQEISVIL